MLVVLALVLQLQRHVRKVDGEGILGCGYGEVCRRVRGRVCGGGDDPVKGCLWRGRRGVEGIGIAVEGCVLGSAGCGLYSEISLDAVSADGKGRGARFCGGRGDAERSVSTTKSSWWEMADKYADGPVVAVLLG